MSLNEISERKMALLVLGVSLIISAFLFMGSITGYAVSTEGLTIANMASIIFLLSGLAGALFLLRKKSNLNNSKQTVSRLSNRPSRKQINLTNENVYNSK